MDLDLKKKINWATPMVYNGNFNAIVNNLIHIILILYNNYTNPVENQSCYIWWYEFLVTFIRIYNQITKSNIIQMFGYSLATNNSKGLNN